MTEKGKIAGVRAPFLLILAFMATSAAMQVEANAAVATFTDRTAFEAATTIIETQDFEGAPGFPMGSGFAFVDDYTIGSLTFDGATNGGVAGDAGIVLINNGFGVPTNSLTTQNFSDVLTIELAGNFTSFGVDVAAGFSPFGPSDVVITLYNDMDAIIAMLTVANLVESQGARFGGVVAMEAIRRITINNQVLDGGEIIDNIALGSSVVPLPAAAPLFLAALAGAGLLGRRRRQA
ncbi:MAG: hypothetical protein GC152_09505 [Alphaproteobacteria bacterium]|nr:hypothetical protein [Alphaproteobacteria bacterium]